MRLVILSVVASCNISYCFSQAEPVSPTRKSESEIKATYAVSKLAVANEWTDHQKQEVIYIIAEFLDNLKHSDPDEAKSFELQRNKRLRKYLPSDSLVLSVSSELSTILFPKKTYRR